MDTDDSRNADVDAEPVEGKPDTEPDTLDATVGLGPVASRALELIGTRLGDYLLLESIGSGGGGHVFKAQHRHMDRIVAVKILPFDTVPDPALVRRFRREVMAAAKLLHPNIVTAFDAGEHLEKHYLVMEYVDGESLAELVLQKGPLPLPEATDYILQAARGLEYAHAKGIIHRDIKPGNIMLDRSGQIKIHDMGLARLNDLTAVGNQPSVHNDLTQHGVVIGTVGYISPEQILSSHDVDFRADIYSLGCTYHFLLTGRPPFSGSLMQTLMAHAHEPPPSLCEWRSDFPAQLDAMLRGMLAKKPSERPATMTEVIGTLELILAQNYDAASIGRAAVPHAWQRRNYEDKASDAGIVAKAVGVDVGSMTAHISGMGDDGLPVAIAGEDGGTVTPSVVGFADGTFAVGQAALDKFPPDDANVIHRFVSQLGRSDSHPTLDGRELPREVLMAVLIRKLAENARKQIGYFTHIVYTLPGCFGDLRRKAYRDAYFLASLKTLDPVNASTAVAVHFSFAHGWLNPRRTAEGKTLLVYRYGAGSFDATVLRVEERRVATLSIAGDSRMGGCRWDDRIAKCVAVQLESQYDITVLKDRAKMIRLRRECEAAKVALSHRPRVPVRFHVEGKMLEGVLSRGFLDKLGSDLRDRSLDLAAQSLRMAGIERDDLDHVLLAGGTSRMPVIQEAVTNWLGDKEKCVVAEPQAAAHGAALCAQVQVAPDRESLDFQVREVTTYDIGILGIDPQTHQKQMRVVIPRNTPLPCESRNTFHTIEHGQASFVLELVEAGHTTAPAVRPIGKCQISNLPPGLPAGTPIEIEFSVATNGTLSMFVESMATGQRSLLEIQGIGGLRPEQRVRWQDWLDTGLMCEQFD